MKKRLALLTDKQTQQWLDRNKNQHGSNKI